jgi:hypothetical protein
MKKIAAILLLISPFCLKAQQWDTITPQGIPVNIIEMPYFHFVSGNTLYAFSDGQDTVVFNLPITDTEIEGYDLSFLITVGNGSYSDGLYYFNPYNDSLTLIDYFLKPQFVDEFNDTLYLGCQGGLFYSTDRFTWQSHTALEPNELVLNYYEFESNKAIVIRKSIENNTIDYVLHSEDNGAIWTTDTLPGELIDSDFYRWTGNLAFILLNENSTTAIYESTDNGNTIAYVNTFPNLSLIDIISGNSFALAHSRDTSNAYGVSLYYPEYDYHTFINDNLPTRNILFIEQFEMDCFNLTVGTDVGAFEICGMFTDIAKLNIPHEFKITPNPASDIISIKTNFETIEPLSIVITNIKGQTIRQFPIRNNPINNHIQLNVRNLDQGCYILSLYSKHKWIGNQKFLKQ